ncbi:hypothetical protein D3C76_1585290 [compost metagenome]
MGFFHKLRTAIRDKVGQRLLPELLCDMARLHQPFDSPVSCTGAVLPLVHVVKWFITERYPFDPSQLVLAMFAPVLFMFRCVCCVG